MAGLKIDSTESRAHFTVTTSTTGPFVINFGNLGKSELEVYVGENTKLSDAQWNFTPNTTQSGNPLDFGSAGGTVTLVSPVANTTVTVVGRQRPIVESDFNSHADFSFPALNAAVARLTLMVRDYKEQVDRLPQYPEGDQLSTPQYFPAKAVRAGTVPYWDANGLIQAGPTKVDVETVAGIAQNIIDLSEPSVVTAIQTLSPAEVVAALLALDDVPAEVTALAGIIPEIVAVDGIKGNVTTVAGVAADVTTVAANTANLAIVAANDANLTLVGDDLALGPSNSFILRAPQAATDAQDAAAAAVGSVAAAATSASDAATSATAADTSADAALSYLASTTAAAGTAVGTVFLPHFVAVSRTTAAQPASPANLDTYILPASPTGAAWGAWAEGDVVRYFTTGASWTRVVPGEGAGAYVQDEKIEVRYENGAWTALSTGFGVSLTTLGATMGESLSQAVYEANDTAIEAFKLTKRITFLEGMIGCWTTKNFRDALKMWASGFALFVATGQDNTRAGAAGLVYKGPATNDAFIWHLESPMGVQPGTVVLTFDPTGAELNVAGNYIEKANSFVEGEYVRYSNGGGTSIGGLTSVNRYYVKDKGVGGANRFKLSATRGGAAIDLTAGATGTAHTLTQADANLEGTDLRGITIDGGLAKYGYVTGRNGYGNSVDRCFFTGGTDTALAILNGFGVKWGHNYVGRCPNVGLRIGENLFGFLTTERYAFAVEGSFHVLYAGHDATLTKLVDYTVVRATLNAPDGSEDDGPNTAETRRYLVGTAPTGTFAGHANEIAEYNPSGPSWSFVAKSNGAIVYDMTANNALLFNGTTWSVDNTKIEKGAGAIVLTTRQGAGLHFTTIERCAGWGLIAGSRANFGPSEVSVGYLERNAGGVLIPYENKSRAPVVNIGFANPGFTHPEQTICIRGQSSVSGATATWLSGATPLADAGPADEAHYLVLNIGHGYNDAGTDGISLYSDTGKYFVYSRDAKIHYGNKVPRNYVDPAQTIVYVNNSTGHDAFPGTSAKPLKTGAEAIRRCKLNKNIVTIEFVGDHTAAVLDVGGTEQTEITVQGSGTARFLQGGSGSFGLTIKGKGARILVSDTFTKVENVDIDGASVKYLSDITSANTGSTHYALRVQNTQEAYFEGTAINANGKRGIRPVNAKLYLLTCTLTNYSTGFSVFCDRGAFLECNYLNTHSAALDFLPPNAGAGAFFEGFITFKDGKKFAYESNAYVSSGAVETTGSGTATLIGETTAGTTGNTGTLEWHKIGKRIFFYIDINTTTFDGTGNLEIQLGSLENAAHRVGPINVENWRPWLSGSNFYPYGVIDSGTNKINLYKEAPGGTPDVAIVRLLDTDLSGAAGSWDGRFILTGSYRTA